MEPEKNVHDDVAFIRQVMAEGRQAVVDNGLRLMGWGAAIVAGITVQYVCLLLRVRAQASIIWGAVLAVGMAFNLIVHLRLRRKQKRRTFAYTVMRSLWTACDAACILLGFVGYRRIDFGVLPALFSLVMGIGMAVTAVIVGKRLLKACAAAWFLGATSMLLFPWVHHLLTFGALMIVGCMLPGFVLYRTWKRDPGAVHP